MEGGVTSESITMLSKLHTRMLVSTAHTMKHASKVMPYTSNFRETLINTLAARMTTLRPFTCNDLFWFNNVNLDPLTETYGLSFYMHYLAHWPEYFQVAESPNGEIMGYIMGKAEGLAENWHGHVTALSVSPDYRRLGLAAMLIKFLEEVSEKKQAYFVDLFVRVSNKVAIKMYQELGYIVYRIVLEYYNGDPDEDAYDMRKALSRDVKKKSLIPLSHPIRPEELD